ncbi:unnamed protein product [Darwinula stevensoni]|uniref:Uncharacterized protein n=1 Tax=Darwinula stevensoni TaxID=69355 RepID=A0A7R8X1F4_9CRUS|nr:unnamed protein product [Darwinula stevensoni]CAG0880185.1 unnamed protein product [Darwinula stevensoni]
MTKGSIFSINNFSGLNEHLTGIYRTCVTHTKSQPCKSTGVLQSAIVNTPIDLFNRPIAALDNLNDVSQQIDQPSHFTRPLFTAGKPDSNTDNFFPIIPGSYPLYLRRETGKKRKCNDNAAPQVHPSPVKSSKKHSCQGPSSHLSASNFMPDKLMQIDFSQNTKEKFEGRNLENILAEAIMAPTGKPDPQKQGMNSASADFTFAIDNPVDSQVDDKNDSCKPVLTGVEMGLIFLKAIEKCQKQFKLEDCLIMDKIITTSLNARNLFLTMLRNSDISYLPSASQRPLVLELLSQNLLTLGPKGRDIQLQKQHQLESTLTDTSNLVHINSAVMASLYQILLRFKKATS